LRRILEGRHITFEMNLEYKGVARFDQYKILRVLQNLVRNARDAIGEGTGQITLSVRLRQEDGALMLSIEDNGPGISEEIRGRLFEHFVTHGKESGTGLGLAIVQKIVQDHQGTVELSSQPGHTVFTITLPQPAGQAAGKSTIPPPMLGFGAKLVKG
jgi:signal transduction histidine kinase